MVIADMIVDSVNSRERYCVITAPIYSSVVKMVHNTKTLYILQINEAV